MSMPSILVVGATGQLGMRLLRELSALGALPRALVRTPEKARAVDGLAIPVMGDLRAPNTLAAAFEGADRVFIVAPPLPEMETIERNAIEAAIASGVRRIVYLSNFAAKEGSDLRPNHIHGLHERIVSESGLEWTVLGPTRYMTNFPFNWTSVLKDGVLLELGGAGLMTCIDPDDVAEIAAKALIEEGHQGRTYRLTSRDAYTARELADLLSAELGRVIRVGDAGAGQPAGYFGLVASGVYKVTDTAAEVLGREPRAYADWLRRNLPSVLSRA
jgi:uncharacterized protein YbjT (DUF2867 family)